MKKTIKIDDLCCQRCADQMAVKLALIDGVRAAKGNYKKGLIFVEVSDMVSDEQIKAVFEGTGMNVLSIEKRKGIFG
ncbi:MAG: heavy-metal-associated domain-containing protein [Clostridia bacterium]|nr:heavy-metal-associated domain-containing protein [Clostridia bacterium]